MSKQRNDQPFEDFKPPVRYESVDVTLARFGLDEQQKAFIYAQAALMKVDAELLDIPENIGEVVKSAMWTREYGFLPGLHIGAMPFNQKAKRKHKETGQLVQVSEQRISIYVSKEAYLACARQIANREGDHIDFQWVELTRAELETYVNANMPKPWDLMPQDRGVKARILSLKTAETFRIMGQPYDPEWSYGFCFMKGLRKSGSNGDWYPKSDADRIPNQRTALDVAVRRAIKAAVMTRYALEPLGTLSEKDRIDQVLRRAGRSEQDSWPRQQKPDHREHDGDVLFYDDEPTHRSTVVEGTFRPADTPVPVDEDLLAPDLVSSEEPEPDVDPTDLMPDPIYDIETLSQEVHEFVFKWRNLDEQSLERAGEAHWGIFTGMIDGHVGKGNHTPVLAAIFHREVDKHNRLSKKLVVAMQKVLSPKRSKIENGRYEKEQETNPDYQDEQAALLKEIGRWVATDSEWLSWWNADV